VKKWPQTKQPFDHPPRDKNRNPGNEKKTRAPKKRTSVRVIGPILSLHTGNAGATQGKRATTGKKRCREGLIPENLRNLNGKEGFRPCGLGNDTPFVKTTTPKGWGPVVGPERKNQASVENTSNGSKGPMTLEIGFSRMQSTRPNVEKKGNHSINNRGNWTATPIQSPCYAQKK